MEYRIVCYLHENVSTSFSMYGHSLSHVTELFEQSIREYTTLRNGLILSDGTRIDINQIIAYRIKPATLTF